MSQPRKLEPRRKQLNLSLTASEFESLARRAEAVGMRPVHFGRALLFEPKRGITASDRADSNLTRLIYSQLARLGNNLNQLLRHLHRTGDPLPADLEPLLKDIRRVLTRVRP